MSIIIPVTSDLVTRNIALFEGELSQTIPSTDKAFIKVLSVDLAMIETEVDKKAIDESKQNLALTATGESLEEIGVDQGIVKSPAVAAVLTGTIPASTGATLPVTSSFVGNSNGVRYFPQNSASEVGGLITVTVTAEETGIAGNLLVGAELTIGSQIAGVGSTLTVTVVDTIGVAAEDEESYRQDVLDNQRTFKGGGNKADNRRFASEVAGVFRAYPFSNSPFDDPGFPGNPPERTVYIEATVAVDPDGIPPGSLLTSVRTSLTTDPVTGIARQPLGNTDATLFVEPIFRTSIFIQITSLVVPPAQETAIKAEIATAIESFLRNVRMFIEGVDFEDDRNDTITKVNLSDIVQEVISSVGGSAERVEFGTVPSVFTTEIITISQGQTTKTGSIVYV